MKFEKIKGAQNHHLFRPYGRDGEIRAVIWVRFFRAEKGRLEESLRTDILGDARVARDLRIAEFLGEKPRFESKVFLVEDKFPEWIDLKKGKAPATLASMMNQWEKHLRPAFGGMLLDEVTESAWLRYVNEKRESDPDRKFYNDRKYLMMFLHWCHRDGLIKSIPKLEDVDPEREEGIVYSDDEVAALIEHSNPDLRAQIICAITMGMRHGEIWSLEWTQINFKKGTIHLPAAKTKIRKARTFVMSAAAAELLQSRKASSESKWVFPHSEDPDQPAGRFGQKSAWDRARDRAGVDGRFHFLRHTFLTRAFKSATNPALICEYAGLSLDEAQKTYLHFTPDDTKVVAALVEVKR